MQTMKNVIAEESLPSTSISEPFDKIMEARMLFIILLCIDNLDNVEFFSNYIHE